MQVDRDELSRVPSHLSRAQREERERISRILNASEELAKQGLLGDYPAWGELLGHIHAMDAATRNFLVIRLRRDDQLTAEQRYRSASEELFARADHRRQLLACLIHLADQASNPALAAELQEMSEGADALIAKRARVNGEYPTSS